MRKGFVITEKWGPWVIAGIAIAIAALALLIVYTRPISEIPATTTKNVFPTSGEQGFNVETFCKDPLTKVAPPSIAPDASGITYTLQRVSDGRTETVVLVRSQDGTWPYAKHFWDDDKQNSDAAFVSDKALECIERKQGQ